MRIRVAMLLATLSATLVAAPAWAAGGGRQPGAVRLTAVAVSADGNVVQVSLRADGPLPPVTAVRTNEGPPRLFVDLAGVVPGDVPARLSGAGPVLRVRTALNATDPPVTRVVFDLAREVTVGIVPAGTASGDVTIAIAAVAAAPDEPRRVTTGRPTVASRRVPARRRQRGPGRARAISHGSEPRRLQRLRPRGRRRFPRRRRVRCPVPPQRPPAPRSPHHQRRGPPPASPSAARRGRAVASPSTPAGRAPASPEARRRPTPTS